MAAINISSVRDGLKTRLATVSGLRAYDVWPDEPQAPAAVVVPGEIDYRTAQDSAFDATFVIHLLCSSASERVGQDQLDSFLASSGATSVNAAIAGDRTLGGAVTDCRLITASNYGRVEVSGQMYFGADLNVGIIA